MSHTVQPEPSPPPPPTGPASRWALVVALTLAPRSGHCPTAPPTRPPTPPSSGGTIGSRGQPLLGGGGNHRRSAHLLRRRGVGRDLQDHRRGACTGMRSSTVTPCSRSGRWAWRRPIPTSSGPGRGEGKIRSHVSVGQGVYKSTDAGATWTLMGLEQTGRIPRLVIHPDNPDIVYICALGHSYGPQPEPRRVPYHRRRRDVGAGAVH